MPKNSFKANISITRFSKQLLWLESRSNDELKLWLKEYIFNGISAPLYIPYLQIKRFEIIKEFHDISTKEEFKERLCEIILYLLNKWRKGVDSYETLFELASLVGVLRILEGNKRLFRLVKSSLLKNVTINGLNLHFFLLRVLAGISTSEDLQIIIRRDIKDEKFASILFTIIWHHNEFKDAFPYFNYMINIYKLKNSVSIKRSFLLFFKSYGLENFHKNFDFILDHIDSKYLPIFFNLLKDIGIILTLHRYGVIIDWKITYKDTVLVHNSKYSLSNEIPEHLQHFFILRDNIFEENEKTIININKNDRLQIQSTIIKKDEMQNYFDSYEINDQETIKELQEETY